MIEYTTEELATWARLGMRRAFGNIMLELAKDHDDLIVLTADLVSSSGLLDYVKKRPSQFFNIGIAEQNMTGIAAGLAKEGHNVFIVSFAPFVSMRALEAVRTLVGYMRLNVKVVALGSGISLGTYGNTHYGLEDIALMRTIPGMRVLTPADCVEMVGSLEYLATYQGPAYLRLGGRPGTPNIYNHDYRFEPGKAATLREGEDAAIFATGSMVYECMRLARPLSKQGISCSVFDMHTIKPLDTAAIDEASGRHKLLVTAEEHSVIGGLGAAVAQHLAGKDSHPPLMTIGIEDIFPHAGPYADLQKQCGLTAPQIGDRIMAHFSRNL